LYLLFLVGAVIVLMNLERTFRAAVGTMRWRIKFMIMGVGVLFAARAYSSSQALLFHAVNPSLQAVNSAAMLVACVLILRSLLRAGHFEVSVYPSHSVLHNSLTVILAGIYLVIVGLLAKIVTFLGGDAAFTLKAFLVLLALVGLTILLLSEKVRLHTKRFVSRHFQRPQYDYRTVWRTFTEGTTRCVEQPALCGALVKLISEVFHVLSVTVWLVDERKEKLACAASSSLSESKVGHLSLDADDTAQLMAALSNRPDPVDIDSSTDIWAVVLRRLHPDEFRKGGNRVCVPMLAGGELVGVVTLGDRVGGVPYSLQDFDLLKSVSEHAAASLLNIHLSQRLSQGKQLEAFQAMSAFFVHDLKNTASTLSLMLQNLPVHFSDPKFREDALRGVAKTVAHINDLISRLSLIRQDTTLQAVEADLNELVNEALKRLADAPRIDLVKALRPLPKVVVDSAQIQNVVTNLVLNARDAVESGGQIRVETSHRSGCAVLAVADNGCGMSPEFVQSSLFRPFQTTKKKGIGIGMFQCKMIVQAHQGRIEVESEPGKGTTFRVILPTTSP
jgi:putative PEP-CTERM system histidine kinase